MKTIYKIIVVVVLLITSNVANTYAQQKILLRDVKSQLPVGNASFQLGKQKGASDKNGVIQIVTSDNNSLVISHISYETIVLQPKDILTALQNGWIELNPSP